MIDSAAQRNVGVVLSYVNMGLQMLVSLLYTPIMLNLLGQSEYGLYSLSNSTISYLSLITLGMGGVYTRFYVRSKVRNDEKGIRELNGMYMLFYGIAAVVAILAGVFLVQNSEVIFKALSPDEVSTTKVLMALLMFNLAISFPCSIFSSYIGATEHFIFQRVVTTVKTFCNPLVVLPVLAMGYGSIGYAVCTVSINLAMELANIIYAMVKLRMRFSFRNFKFSLLREVFVFSFFILLNQIIDQVNGNVGNFLLGVFQGSLAVAVYGVAQSITGYFFQFSTAISSVYSTRVNEMIAKEQGSRALTDLMIQVGRVQFMVMALLLSGLIVFGRPFVWLWAGEGYTDAYYIILLICIPVTVPLIQNIGIEIQRAMNKHHIRSIAYAIMALFNVLVSIPMIRIHGAVGAAIGTSVSYVVCNIVFMNFYYHMALGLDMVRFWKSISRFIPALVLPSLCGIMIATSSVNLYSWQMLMPWIGVYTVVYLVSMALFGLNRDERAFLVHNMNKVFKRRTCG